jgi:hypothetical protein
MHRLFVAIRPPADVRNRLLDLMHGVPGLRWQDDGQLHLTLRFIGEVERPVAEDLAVELARVRFDPFPIELGGIGRFDRRRGGALWAGVKPKEPPGFRLNAALSIRTSPSPGGAGPRPISSPSSSSMAACHPSHGGSRPSSFTKATSAATAPIMRKSCAWSWTADATPLLLC